MNPMAASKRKWPVGRQPAIRDSRIGWVLLRGRAVGIAVETAAYQDWARRARGYD
jgi:hypothetical protein